MSNKTTDFLRLADEILTRGNKLLFQAPGESMRPFIMNGDILEIEPFRKESLRPGDVIFYHDKDGRAIAHRIVRKITRDNRLIFLTKGDSNTSGIERVYADQIVGRVNAIERDKKKILINQRLNRYMYIVYSGILPLLTIAKKIAGILLSHIQGLKAYRHLAKKIITPEIIYQWGPGGNPGKDLLVKANDIVIARTNIEDYSADNSSRQGWWIFGMWVHWRYRGLGIGSRLTEMACNLAAEQGAPDVKLLVFKENKPAVNLYQKLGFSQVSIPRIDKELKKEAGKTKRLRIIMKKDF